MSISWVAFAGCFVSVSICTVKCCPIRFEAESEQRAYNLLDVISIQNMVLYNTEDVHNADAIKKCREQRRKNRNGQKEDEKGDQDNDNGGRGKGTADIK